MFYLNPDDETSGRRSRKLYEQILGSDWKVLKLCFGFNFQFLTRDVELGYGRAQHFGNSVAWGIWKTAPAIKLSGAVCSCE